MKHILTLLFSGLLSLSAVNGQSSKKIDVSVRDNNKKPAGGTMVDLVNADNLTTVQYGITATDGSIEFDKLKDGNYIVFIPAVNGINYRSSVLTVNKGVGYIKLSVITLNKAADNSITIVGKSNKTVTAS